MDINILPMLSVDLYELAGSRAERGENVAEETWANSVEMGKQICLLKTPEEIENTKKWILDFGAWTEKEVASWTDDEVNAWLVQCVALDLREMEGCESMADYEQQAKEGTISGRCWFEGIEYVDGEFILGENPVACIYIGS